MGGRVLITEVQDECRTILAMLLKDMGCDVIEASNGLDAVVKAVTMRPDLILMDLRMPKLGGLEAMRRLKTNPSTEDIPVVICTSLGTRALGYATLCDAPVEVIKKPIRFERLREIIQKYLPHENQQQLSFAIDAKPDIDLLSAWRLLRQIKHGVHEDSFGGRLSNAHNFAEPGPDDRSDHKDKDREAISRLLSTIKGGKPYGGTAWPRKS